MSYLKTLVQNAVTAIDPDATFENARRFAGQKTAHKLEAASYPLYLYDDLSGFPSTEGEVFPNFNYTSNERFILTALQKIDTHAQDSDKSDTADLMKLALESIFGEIYKNISIQSGFPSVRHRIVPLPELYASWLCGASLDMTVPILKSITACTP